MKREKEGKPQVMKDKDSDGVVFSMSQIDREALPKIEHNEK